MTFDERLTLFYARGQQNFEIAPVYNSSIKDIEKTWVLDYMDKIDYGLSYEDFQYENKL